MEIRYRTKKKIIGCIFLIPVTILLVLFLIDPLIESIYKSFTNWNGFTTTAKFVGLRNYIKVFTDSPEFWHGMKVSFLFAIYTAIFQSIIGFGMAYLIYYSSKRLQNFLKVLLYIPVIIPATAVGLMWMQIYSPDTGLLNSLLRLIGLGSIQPIWLGDYNTALFAVVIANTWRYAGFTMMLYLIALLAIPPELVEAAEMDGANRFHILKNIFLPLTLATTEINGILTFSGSMKSFDMFYITTQGGPGDATRVAGIVIYGTAFQEFNFAKALVMSLIMFVFILGLTIFARALMNRKEGGQLEQ